LLQILCCSSSSAARNEVKTHGQASPEMLPSFATQSREERTSSTDV
jgi:hypothetical protein